MPLVAMLDGNRLRADQYTPESWRALQDSEDRRRLTMPVCGVRAVAKARSDTRFFSHLRLAGCNVDHGGESAQHLALKVALAGRIDAVPGWHAVIEHPHPSREWIIDVLAESDDQRYRVAFEVQLSSQTMDDYLYRTQRYWDSGVFSVWLVPRQLEYSRFEVPVVVTGFGKTSEVPDDPSILMNLEIRQNFHPAKGTLGHFVSQLLLTGSHWSKGSPDQQRKALETEARRHAVEQEAHTRKLQKMEHRLAETNRLSASPESRFGAHTVHTETGPFVWATTTPCWKCSRPMLVWEALSTTPGQQWASAPQLDVKVNVGLKRYENHGEVHQAVDRWIEESSADILKAKIKQQFSKTAGGSYSAFTCPHCASLMGQFFIASISPENWSLISAPLLKSSQPVTASPVNHRTAAWHAARRRPPASLPAAAHPRAQ